MQPSMTPRPSARAACAIRTASRIPPDLASLMLTPCARSAQAGDVGRDVAVLVDVDRERRALLEGRRRRDRPRAAAARSTRRRAPRAAAGPRAPRPATTTRSRPPSAASCVTPRTARTRSTSRPSPPPSFSFSRLNLSPTASARRAMSSGSPSQIVQDVGGPARRSPSSRQTGRPASFPCRSWSAASMPARAANCSRGRRASISSSAQGSSPSASACSSRYASADSADCS